MNNVGKVDLLFRFAKIYGGWINPEITSITYFQSDTECFIETEFRYGLYRHEDIAYIISKNDGTLNDAIDLNPVEDIDENVIKLVHLDPLTIIMTAVPDLFTKQIQDIILDNDPYRLFIEYLKTNPKNAACQDIAAANRIIGDCFIMLTSMN